MPNSVFKISLVLLCLVLTTIAMTYSVLAIENYALQIVLCFILFALSFFTVSLFTNQHHPAQIVLTALTNGDNSISLPKSHPSHGLYNDVRDQLLTARLKAEEQSQFMNALMVHIDMAVIVLDSNGLIIKKNPAVQKLLGLKIDRLEQLEHIGDFVESAKESCRTTAPWSKNNKQDTLSVQVSCNTLQGANLKIITLQSIHGLLLAKEQQAYKRLSKVLTHEVANSITPLASMAETCLELIPTDTEFDYENRQDLTLALKTIEARTHNLGKFISQFRSISNLPQPELTPQRLQPIIERVIALYQSVLIESKIEVITNYDSENLVMLDVNQIEQVLINLTKNAIESLNTAKKVKKSLTFSIFADNTGQLMVEVSDNGTGIQDSTKNMLFTPFFTTKQGGSGIGLALSKQIMVGHGGDLIVTSHNELTTFCCVFS